MKSTVLNTFSALALMLSAPAFAQDAAATTNTATTEATATATGAAETAPAAAVEAAPAAAIPTGTDTAAAAPVEAATPVEATKPVVAPATAGIGAPEEGKGQVVFFRMSGLGALVGFKVREGATELGKLKNSSYFVVPVEPGKHQYTVHSEAKDQLTLEVEAGETYYVSGVMQMGILVGRPNISPSNAAAFQAALPKLKLSTN